MSGKDNMDKQYTYTELLKAADSFIKKIDNFIGKAINFAKSHNRKNYLKLQIDSESPKKEAEFMEYQTPDQIVYKSWEYNREHSLDTLILNEFNRTNDTDIEQVKISYGPAADEYARQNHALALVVANTIYFRNGAYKPETEEGRKLLAHELTHIAQNKDTEAYRNSTVEEKEAEAEAKEVQQEYNPDPEIVIKIKGKYKRIRKSKIKREISALAEMEVEKIQNEYAMISNEKKKLDYLINLETRLKRGEIKWLQ